jgi:transcriptional regulator with XRE-family HTH domain
MGLPASKEKYEKLRLLLIEVREKAGLTQVELGDRLGRPQSFVSKIERGVRSIDVVEFVEIARAIGIDPIKLIRVFVSPEKS